MEIDGQKELSSAKLSKSEVILLLFFCIIGLCFVVISFTCLTPIITPSNINQEIDTGGNPTNPVAVLGSVCSSQEACGFHLKVVNLLENIHYWCTELPYFMFFSASVHP